MQTSKRIPSALMAVAVSAVVWGGAAAPATGQASGEASALINEALDQPVTLSFTGTTLPGVLEAILEQTGVPVRVEPSAYDLLPYGRRTPINVAVSDVPLREAIDAIAGSLSLEGRLGDQELVLRPTPALQRLGRRATIAEMQALGTLRSTPLDVPAELPLSELIRRLDERLLGLDTAAEQAGTAEPGLAIESRVTDGALRDKQVLLSGVKSTAEALEAVASQTGATWYVWEKDVVVLPKSEHVRMMLQRPVSVRYTGADVVQVLTDLSNKANVRFVIEPGAVQRIPPEYRSVRLVLDNVSIAQALESLAGATGLGVLVEDYGVYIWNQTFTGAPADGQPRDRVIALLQFEDGTQILLPESRVPPDVRAYLDSRVDRTIEGLRRQMEAEGFEPTAPATPATQRGQ
ncbi:MAG: hypothetical protein ACFCVE_08770 [Phycisphaerae bacterium]